MNKAYKYRIYPTDAQQSLLLRTFGCCRKIYNLMLEVQKKSLDETGKLTSVTPAMFKQQYPFLREVDSLALANKQMDLQQAFKNFFDKKRKKRCRFPKFKSRKRCRRSYTTNNKNGTIEVLDKGIKLPKVGIIKAKIQRRAPEDWLLKSATVSQERDGSFYVSVLYEYEADIQPVPVSDNAIGLDYASDGLYVDEFNRKGTNHKFFCESQRKLAKAQRRLSRKKGSKKNEKKSQNYWRQLKKVNRIQRHIANQRADNLHKISTEIANQYDVVCVETLNMQAMANKGVGNGKATLDNGYGKFLVMLQYKLAERGKHFVKIDKWFPSSQLCHQCGTIHPEMKDLKVTNIVCDCGLTMNRNQNAAINIKREGLRTLMCA